MRANGAVRVVAVNGSVSSGGHTASLIRAMCGGLAGAQVDRVDLCEGIPRAIRACDQADALLVASPTYRASFSGLLKTFLDNVPRGLYPGEPPAVLAGKPVAIAMSGADWRHALALDDLRNLLSGFFAAVVVPPGIYVPDCAWRDDQLAGDFAALAVQQSSALVELVSLIQGSRWLRQCRPQA